MSSSLKNDLRADDYVRFASLSPAFVTSFDLVSVAMVAMVGLGELLCPALVSLDAPQYVNVLGVLRPNDGQPFQTFKVAVDLD
ncbi:hypothetical protein B484DRAFT_405492 [Ochromonadaceae sp. CCMP2298]|nr:hypothetical protein B484DRAFT_405492 [Ochromonadaceae sp. CCMP2298]